jgi:hypothetical protein
LADLELRSDHFTQRRAEAVARLACLPLGDVVPRVIEALRPILAPRSPQVPAAASPLTAR